MVNSLLQSYFAVLFNFVHGPLTGSQMCQMWTNMAGVAIVKMVRGDGINSRAGCNPGTMGALFDSEPLIKNCLTGLLSLCLPRQLSIPKVRELKLVQSAVR